VLISKLVIASSSAAGLGPGGRWHLARVRHHPGEWARPCTPDVEDDHAAAFLAGAGYLTGYLALMEIAKFRPGQTVLAPAIGSAVGMETVQIERRLGASIAISTSTKRRPSRLAQTATNMSSISPTRV
jgi:NADPH:quinone reductase-like Zn-dependent oxidoreductase